MLGHREKAPQRARGMRTWCFEIRRLDPTWRDSWSAFLRGESRAALSALIVALLDKPRARRDPAAIQADVDALERFYRHEALKLAEARRRTGETRWPVPQTERDALFIRARRAALVTG